MSAVTAPAEAAPAAVTAQVPAGNRVWLRSCWRQFVTQLLQRPQLQLAQTPAQNLRAVRRRLWAFLGHYLRTIANGEVAVPARRHALLRQRWAALGLLLRDTQAERAAPRAVGRIVSRQSLLG